MPVLCGGTTSGRFAVAAAATTAASRSASTHASVSRTSVGSFPGWRFESRACTIAPRGGFRSSRTRPRDWRARREGDPSPDTLTWTVYSPLIWNGIDARALPRRLEEKFNLHRRRFPGSSDAGVSPTARNGAEEGSNSSRSRTVYRRRFESPAGVLRGHAGLVHVRRPEVELVPREFQPGGTRRRPVSCRTCASRRRTSPYSSTTIPNLGRVRQLAREPFPFTHGAELGRDEHARVRPRSHAKSNPTSPSLTMETRRARVR